MKIKSITGRTYRIVRRVVVTGAVIYTAGRALILNEDRRDRNAAELK